MMGRLTADEWNQAHATALAARLLFDLPTVAMGIVADQPLMDRLIYQARDRAQVLARESTPEEAGALLGEVWDALGLERPEGWLLRIRQAETSDCGEEAQTG